MSKYLPSSFSSLHPIFKRDLEFKQTFSFLSEILEKIIIERCCLGCNQLKMSTTENYKQQVVEQFNISTRSDLLLPMYGNSIATFKLPYQPLVELKHIAIIGKKLIISPHNYMTHLIKSTFKTWPLLLMALLMAICAGSIIWLLVRIIFFHSQNKG